MFFNGYFVKSNDAFEFTEVLHHTPAVASSNLVQLLWVCLFPPWTCKRQDITWNYVTTTYHILSNSFFINPLTPELNPSAQRCLTRSFTADFASWTVHFVNICVKTNKCNNYSFSLLIMYGSSYMFRHYIAISGSFSSAFWEMLNWGAVDLILWMGVLCIVTWCVAISDFSWVF
jgi:hypothetical protein